MRKLPFYITLACAVFPLFGTAGPGWGQEEKKFLSRPYSRLVPVSRSDSALDGRTKGLKTTSPRTVLNFSVPAVEEIPRLAQATTPAVDKVPAPSSITVSGSLPSLSPAPAELLTDEAQPPEENSPTTAPLDSPSLLSYPAPTDNGTPISALEAVAIARSPAIAALDRAIEAARGEMVQAGLRLNPEFEYELQDVEHNGLSGTHGAKFSQEIQTGGKRFAAVRDREWAMAVFCQKREEVTLGLRNEVRTLAWQFLAARRMVEIRGKLVELAQATEKQGEKLLKAGEITQMNQIQLQVQTNEAKLGLIQSKNRLTSVKSRLMALLNGGDHSPDESLLDPSEETIGPFAETLESILDLPSPDRTLLLTQLLEESPQIRRCETIIRQKQSAVTLAESRRQANITIGGSVNYDPDYRDSYAEASVKVPIQIFDRNQGNVQSARNEEGGAIRERDRLRQVLRQKFAVGYQEFSDAREAALLYRTSILPDLERSYRMNFEAFRNAEIEFLDMSISQVTYFKATAEYIDALLRLAVARTQLEGMFAEQEG